MVSGSMLLSSALAFQLHEQPSTDVNTNMTPVIGLVSQPLPETLKDDPRFDGTDSYMMAAYVKFAMASGARVVPLIWGEPEQTTMDKLALLNGVLFPGGGGDYIEYGRSILNRLIEYNDNGLVYPAIGICLGFENMAIWAADLDRDILEPYNAHAISLPIYFTDDPANSWVFGPMGDRAYDFENNNQTLNSHSWGVDPNAFNFDAGLGSFYKLTSISYEPDIPYAPFTASMEAYDYPFFATQFHPEKTFTMFNDDSGINHSWESI